MHIDNMPVLSSGGHLASSDGDELITAAPGHTWEEIPGGTPHTAAKQGQHIGLAINAVVGGQWYVFGGQFGVDAATSAAWSTIPKDLANAFLIGPRPTTTTHDVRESFRYNPVLNEWQPVAKLPCGFVSSNGFNDLSVVW